MTLRSVDHEDNKVVAVPRWAMKATNGDARDAMVFAQITWWFQPDQRYGQPRTSHLVQRQGHRWMYTTDEELAKDIGMTARQVGRARHSLVKQDLIVCKSSSVDGAKVTLIRVAEKVTDVTDPPPEEVTDVTDQKITDVTDLPYTRTAKEAREASDAEAPDPTPPSEEAIEAARLCELFADLIGSREGCQRPHVSKAWLTDMERLIRLDGRPPDAIERTLRWLDAAADDVSAFWRPNVRSPEKLRAKWDQMREQVALQRRGNGKHNGNGQSRADAGFQTGLRAMGRYGARGNGR